MSALSIAEVLEKAANLIEPEGKWTQGDLAVDANGDETWTADPNSVCFCAEGAIMHVSFGQPREPIFREFRHALGVDRIYEWNDAPGRTQAEVVAKLREAAALAREQGK